MFCVKDEEGQMIQTFASSDSSVEFFASPIFGTSFHDENRFLATEGQRPHAFYDLLLSGGGVGVGERNAHGGHAR